MTETQNTLFSMCEITAREPHIPEEILNLVEKGRVGQIGRINLAHPLQEGTIEVVGLKTHGIGLRMLLIHSDYLGDRTPRETLQAIRNEYIKYAHQIAEEYSPTDNRKWGNGARFIVDQTAIYMITPMARPHELHITIGYQPIGSHTNGGIPYNEYDFTMINQEGVAPNRRSLQANILRLHTVLQRYMQCAESDPSNIQYTFKRPESTLGPWTIPPANTYIQEFFCEVNALDINQIGGQPNAVREIQGLIHMIKHNEAFITAGINIPRGVILVGPPGCGKTSLARAFSTGAELPFYLLEHQKFSSSQKKERIAAILEGFYNLPKGGVLLVDEIETFLADQELVTVFKTAMDGYQPTHSNSSKHLILGTTNQGTNIDRDLFRSGRFSKVISVPHPSIEGLVEIAQLKLQQRKLTLQTTQVRKLAGMAHRLKASGADIDELISRLKILELTDNTVFLTDELILSVFTAIQEEKALGSRNYRSEDPSDSNYKNTHAGYHYRRTKQ